MNDIERVAYVIQNQRNRKELAEVSREIDDDNSTLTTPTSLLNVQATNESKIRSVDIKLENLQSDAIEMGVSARNDNTMDLAESEKSRYTTTDYFKSTIQGNSASNTDNIKSVDHTQSDTQDVAAKVSKKIQLPLTKLAKQGFITPALGKSLLTEEYRRIKRPLLKNLTNYDQTLSCTNVIAVTSSISGEGKTYTALNLAMSLALERDRTVLLIDTDVIKGSASQLLGIPERQPGLTDLLSDRIVDPSDVILRTNVPSLTCMSAGTKSDDTYELLSSDIMDKFVSELSSRYSDRIILMDCPPILQTNEANIITEYAGQVVFVVAEQDTSQSQVAEALNQFDNEAYVGVVLNKSSNSIANSGYRYTYNYH